MSIRSFASEIARLKTKIPQAPILDDAHLALLFNQIGVFQDQIFIARAQHEQATGKGEENKSVSRLLTLELQLARASAHAYKMAAIKSLSLATEQSNLFQVEEYFRVWQHAEHMINAVDAEIKVREALAGH